MKIYLTALIILLSFSTSFSQETKCECYSKSGVKEKTGIGGWTSIIGYNSEGEQLQYHFYAAYFPPQELCIPRDNFWWQEVDAAILKAIKSHPIYKSSQIALKTDDPDATPTANSIAGGAFITQEKVYEIERLPGTIVSVDAYLQEHFASKLALCSDIKNNKSTATINDNKSKTETSNTPRTNKENTGSGTVTRNQSNQNQLDDMIDNHNQQSESLNQAGDKLLNTIDNIFNQPKSQAEIAKERAREEEEARRQKAINKERKRKNDSISYHYLKIADNENREKQKAEMARVDKIRKQEWEDNKGFNSNSIKEAKEVLNSILKNPSKQKLQDFLSDERYGSQFRNAENYLKFWDEKSFILLKWNNNEDEKEKEFETLKYHLNLTFLNISGQKIDFIPESIFKNGTLRTIAINETSVYKLPENIVNNKRLEILFLKRNKNLKEFLNTFSYFPELEQLILQLNSSRSKIPYLGDLKNLRKLHINQYSEVIPDGVFQLTNLKVLGLYSIQPQSGNILTEELGRLTNLEYLSINHSHFIELPKSIKNLQNLKELNLYNSWINDLPSELKELKKLEKIKIGGNQYKPYQNRKVEKEIKKLLKILPNLKVVYD